MISTDDPKTLQLPAQGQRGPRRWVTVFGALAVTATVAGVLAVGAPGEGGDAERIGTRLSTTPSVPPSSAAPSTAAPASTGPPAAASPAVAPTPTTSAPPTTVPERLTGASRLRLDGIGPVTVGMTLAEASAAAGVPIRLQAMPPGPECRYAAPDRASGLADELAFMVIDGRIVRIDVGITGADRIRTLSGIGKGDTEAEVLAAYPGRLRIQPHAYVPGGKDLVYVPSDPGMRHLSLIFEVIEGEVRSFRSGFVEPVSWKEGCS